MGIPNILHVTLDSGRLICDVALNLCKRNSQNISVLCGIQTSGTMCVG